ncbi:MAG: nucleotidyltransferase [Gemmataceae bacterium]
MRSLVGFADADAFYSSAEVVRRPWLKDAEVGVLGNQGACVIARSYAMKRAGVKVGMPIWEAKELCPDGVYVKRDFRWYEAVSRRLLAELNLVSPRVEYHSIDEFFWKHSPVRQRDPVESALELRDHIKQRIGVPVTVSIGRTRTLAKLFADTHKPFGAVAVTDPMQERELLAAIPVTEIAGIAKRRAARLEPFNIRTCLDLRDASGLLVKQLLTITGHDLWLELNGVTAQPIRPERTPHKNIARGGSLAGRVSDPLKIYGWLVRNVERLIEELRYHVVRPRLLAVYMNYADGAGGVGQVRLPVPADRFDVVLDAAKQCLRSAWKPGREATHMHVIASHLARPHAWQQSLFEGPDPRLDTLAEVKASINERFGRWKVRSGATLFANEFYQDAANEFDICDVRGKFCF